MPSDPPDPVRENPPAISEGRKLPSNAPSAETAVPIKQASEAPLTRAEKRQRNVTWLLFFTVLVIATSGIVYELVAGAVASYVLGDSITQFSLVIGVYLSALGVGAYLSKFIDKSLMRVFVEVELATALVGGLSAPLLFLSFAYTRAFGVILYGIVLTVGTLVGLELPLLIRILRSQVEFKDLLARALSFDYIGSLVGSLLFSLLMVPKLGLVRTSLLFGILNALVGIGSTWLIDESGRKFTGLRVRGAFIVVLLSIGFLQADRVTQMSEEQIYADDVIFAKQSAYQRIVLTRSATTFQLFLNGNLQFSSGDEYRYHEALVHPAFATAASHKHVLVLGGGDGLAAREIFRYPGVETVTLVDIDPAMTATADKLPLLRELNEGSLHNTKLTVVHEDAMVWIGNTKERFDVAIIDFPDPNNFALGKLYTSHFYKRLAHALTPGASVVVQATSPLFARSSYWCIVRTMEAGGFSTRPFHVAVPSFGEWGYVLAKKEPFEVPHEIQMQGLRFLDPPSLQAMFVFSKDMSELPVEVNRLNNQVLVQYYEREWRRWN
ncbi:MAG: polyamine aminopropyltransferase [Polyangiaceae bacterium]|nr:polyamine aminopropyltransferase [Polyangiaceae bacterium]